MTDTQPFMDEAMENRIWFDTEFIEDGKTIDLLSIGLVKADGSTYYAESAEADLSRADDWVKANVLVHLDGQTKPRKQIAEEIVEFAGKNPAFWAYYADYDWVVLCQLYGRMIDLPKGWPMFCRDIKQLCMDVGNPPLPEQGKGAHNALADARWNKEAFDFLNGMQATALSSAYQRGREESHAEMERLRWRHPCVIPEWGDLPQELRRRLVELGDCYTDESISGDFMLHVYEEMRTAIRTERDKG